MFDFDFWCSGLELANLLFSEFGVLVVCVEFCVFGWIGVWIGVGFGFRVC